LPKKPVTVLDVRPKAEREEWSIPGSVHADVLEEPQPGYGKGGFAVISAVK
jgi:rhodanese-related sulfurtransferase